MLKKVPGARVRLERPFVVDRVGRPIYVDIVLGGVNEAVELKYKTRRLQKGGGLRLGEEHFSLANQSAQDEGSYCFVKDLTRLEQLVRNKQVRAGHAILLTNDPLYWGNPPRRAQSNYDSFRLTDKRRLQGTLDWRRAPSKGSWPPLSLEREYELAWNTYSAVSEAPSHGAFRYLALKVEAKRC